MQIVPLLPYLGVIALAIGILGALNYNRATDSGAWFWWTLAGAILMAIWAWQQREEWIERLSAHASVIGNILVILGVGILTAWLPEALRYVFQDSAYLGAEEAIFGSLGAMLIAGGWFLRQSARRE